MPDQPKHGEKDRVYKQFYSFAEVVEEVAVEIVGESVGGDWVDDLDFGTLEPAPREFVDAERETVRMVDMAWRVRFRDRPLWLVLLFEFQSKADKRMATRAGRLRAGLALRFERDPERVAQALAVLEECLATSALREAYVAWIRVQMIDWKGPEETIGQLDTLKEVAKVYANHISKVAQEAQTLGEARAYVETAKWKFGADAAERLADMLAGVTDRSRLARLGRLLAECETGEELIGKAGGD